MACWYSAPRRAAVSAARTWAMVIDRPVRSATRPAASSGSRSSAARSAHQRAVSSSDRSLDLPDRRLVELPVGDPDPVGDLVGEPAGDQGQPRVGRAAVGQLPGEPSRVDRRPGQTHGPAGGVQGVADAGEVGVQALVGATQWRRELLLLGRELPDGGLPGHGVGQLLDQSPVDLAAHGDRLEGRRSARAWPEKRPQPRCDSRNRCSGRRGPARAPRR